MADYQPAETPKNNESLVLRLRYGRRSFLLAGDVERQVEDVMLDAGEVYHTDVLKVAHHGSKCRGQVKSSGLSQVESSS